MLLEEMFLFEEMTINMALSKFGISHQDFERMTPEELKAKWKELMKKYHPDLGNKNSGIDVGEINAAYDYLKNWNSSNSNYSSTGGFQPSHAERFRRSEENPLVPPWQPDKHSYNNKIHVQSYRDLNYLKKHLWELSYESEKIYTINAFGKHNFEGRINVYGTPETFAEMVQAMLVYNSNGNNPKDTRAIFITPQDEPNKLMLVYADGRMFDKPIPLDVPTKFNDPKFEEKIVMILEKLHQMYNR